MEGVIKDAFFSQRRSLNAKPLISTASAFQQLNEEDRSISPTVSSLQDGCVDQLRGALLEVAWWPRLAQIKPKYQHHCICWLWCTHYGPDIKGLEMILLDPHPTAHEAVRKHGLLETKSFAQVMW